MTENVKKDTDQVTAEDAALLERIRRDPTAVREGPTDPAFGRRAVRANPWALRHMAPALRGDRSVVREAVACDGAVRPFPSTQT